MPVREVFCDFTRGSGGSGTVGDPIGSVWGIPWGNNLRLRFRRGKVHKLNRAEYAGIDVPVNKVSGLEITDFGDAEERATLDGSIEFSNWTKYSGNIWVVNGVPKTVGVVMQNGVPLNWVNGTGGVGSFLSKMREGSYAYDHNNSIYVWLRGGGNPNDAGNLIEVASTGVGINVNGSSDLQVNNLRIIGCARQGSNVLNISNAEFIDNVVEYCGGAYDHANRYYLGGALQCTSGVRNILYERNVCVDVYDSPLSPQLVRSNVVSDGIIMRRNVLGNFALAGVEIANWGDNTVLRNVVIEDNYIYGGGKGWSGTGDNANYTEGVIINGRPRFENIDIVRNVIEDIDHSGIEIRDAQCTNVRITQNQIRDCRYGIRNFAGQNLTQQVTASFNEISNCSEYGIMHSTRLNPAVCHYRKNTLVNNGNANIFLTKVETAVPVVKDNNCYGARYGIQKSGTKAVNPQYNNAYSASSQNFAGVNKGQTNLSVDPKFQNLSNGDYQLAKGSPLIDAGSGTSPGADVIDQEYKTDDVGCHAYVQSTVDLSGRVDLEALTS